MSRKQKISALDVSKYFILKSNEDNSAITNKKLQKLLYYAQVWSLVKNDKKLFPERIEAWVHGPAIPVVYRKYKTFGFNNISEDLSNFSVSIFSKKEIKLLENIWNVYGKYTAEYLEALTHSETPWQKARKDLAAHKSSSNIISLKLAKSFYNDLLKKTRNS